MLYVNYSSIKRGGKKVIEKNVTEVVEEAGKCSIMKGMRL